MSLKELDIRSKAKQIYIQSVKSAPELYLRRLEKGELAEGVDLQTIATNSFFCELGNLKQSEKDYIMHCICDQFIDEVDQTQAILNCFF